MSYIILAHFSAFLNYFSEKTAAWERQDQFKKYFGYLFQISCFSMIHISFHHSISFIFALDQALFHSVS